jgi:hypothetical protein
MAANNNWLPGELHIYVGVESEVEVAIGANAQERLRIPNYSEILVTYVLSTCAIPKAGAFIITPHWIKNKTSALTIRAG